MSHRAVQRLQLKTTALCVGIACAAPALAADVAMTEFFYTPLGYYFITPNAGDKTALDGAPGWTRTGNSFVTSTTAVAGAAPLTRFYFDQIARNKKRGSHFYTAIEADRVALRGLNPSNAATPGLPVDEGSNGYVFAPTKAGVGGTCAAALLPVYRAFRGNANYPDDPNHRFSTDVTAHTALVADGWDDDGVNFCVPASSSEKASVTLTVLDGPIGNAEVCLDRNGDGLCGSGEETTRTSANGVATLQIPVTDSGNYRWLARVGADAVSAETGGVTTAYNLTASTIRGTVMSPLTTLVQTYMAANGVGLGDAERWVKAQTGITVSPLDDYSKAYDATAANFSRMLVAAIQAQTRLLLPLIGQNDLLGVPIARADIDRVVTTALLTLVPELVVAAKDASITAATTPAARDAAIAKLANAAVGTGADALVAPYATATIALAKLPKSTAPTAKGESAGMPAFSFTDANNWFFRAFASTADDNKVGTDGLRRYYDLHRQMSGGTVTEWGSSDTLARSKDVHWSGTAWRDCLVGMRGGATPTDVGGNWLSYYCDGRSASRVSRSIAPIENRLMSDVIAEFRRFPGSDGGVAYSNWGPSNLAALGAATFPAGANVQYITSTNIANAYRYDVTAAPHTWPSIAVAAGGDSRVTANLACAATGTAPTTVTATLEDMIAKAPGKPCVFGVNTNADGTSLNPSESWGNTSLSLGTITNGTALPAGTGSYFSTNLRIRVAFTGGNGVSYLSCLERRSDTSTRNCTTIGTGTYKIETLGDGRALTFQNQPLEATAFGYSRVMIERGGKIYYGFQTNTGGTGSTMRLNLPAINALFGKLGIPQLVP
jgi:trimeric autotransporter adhesin